MRALSVPQRTNQVLLAIVLDVGLTLLSLYLASEVRLALPFGKELNEPSVQVNQFVYLLTSAIWVLVFSQFGLYTRHWVRFRDEWGVLVIAVLSGLLILAGCLYLSFRQVSRLQFLYFGAIDLLLLSLVRVARFIRRALAGEHEAWRVLIAGSGPIGRSLAERLSMQRAAGLRVIGFLDEDPALCGQSINGFKVIGAFDAATEIIRREHVAEIVLALPHEAYERMLALTTELEQLPVQVSLVPDVLDMAWFMTRVDDLNGVPLLRLRESPLNGPVRALKRLMDIVLASVLLIVSAPVMLIAAILVKLDSSGPALIRQKRIGENAQPFGMVKFRTMYAGAETVIPGAEETGRRGEEAKRSGGDAEQSPREVPDSQSLTPSPQPPAPLHKRPDDPRITRVGRFLRHYSIDELPQLFNVLRGEMSLVGPRPELPWLVDCYESWQRHRFAVPPGMTGWWQIHGRSDRPMHLNVEDDLYYIRNYSLWLDIVILLRTIPVVLTGRGAY